MKQSNKDLSKVFFNSVEEMNEFYVIDAELPSNLQSNADLVCYEIVEPHTYEEVCQYKFEEGGLECFAFGRWCGNLSNTDNEILLNKHDLDNYEGRCFVYVRVNEYLRKHLEKNLLGCEFIFCHNEADTQNRRFVHSVEARTSGIVITDQDGLSGYLSEQLFYPDDYSDPIPYKEWVKKINEQDVEVECGDTNKKPYANKKQNKGSHSEKQNSQSEKQSVSSTLVKKLTKSEIESLRQNKRDAYELMEYIEVIN